MPPEENKLKIGIDPVFKGKPDQQPKMVDQNNPTSAFDVLNNQGYSPAAKPTLAEALRPVSSNQTNPKSIVRTYKGDIASAIQADHLSSINIAVAENEKMHSQIQAATNESAQTSDYSKNKIIIFISLLLIVLGVVAITITLLVRGQGGAPAVQVQAPSSLVVAEYKDELNTSAIAPNQFPGTLSNKLNATKIPVNNIYSPYLTIGTSSSRRLITSAEFVSLLGFDTPDIIKRTLRPDFMVGVYSWDGQNLPFVILETSSFENTYAGMLVWEAALANNFAILFRLSGYGNAGNILASLTPATSTQNFTDGVIVNQDVRLIRDNKGNIVLLYGIINKKNIIITVNDTTFKEIVNRLNNESGLER